MHSAYMACKNPINMAASISFPRHILLKFAEVIRLGYAILSIQYFDGVRLSRHSWSMACDSLGTLLRRGAALSVH